MNSLRVAEGKILYECSLNIEGDRRYVHLRCAQGFRWKLPAEPERLLPITSACLTAVEKITRSVAQAAKAGRKAPFLQTAVDTAKFASEAAELPVGETKDELYGHKRQLTTQCILFPRWIPRNWPIPSFGQTLAESFRALAHQLTKCGKNWPCNLQQIVSSLDGFWEQLLRAQKASLASSNSWSIYHNPVFDDRELEVRPNLATALYNQIFFRRVESEQPVAAEDLESSLTSQDLQDLDKLLDEYLQYELPSVSSSSDLADKR